jgi:hypothetical protein
VKLDVFCELVELPEHSPKTVVQIIDEARATLGPEVSSIRLDLMPGKRHTWQIFAQVPRGRVTPPDPVPAPRDSEASK